MTAICARLTPGCRWAPRVQSPRGCGCPRPWHCPSSTIRSRWRSRSPRWITFPAAACRWVSDSAGTQTNWPTTTCHLGDGARCCASTWKPCARCGPKKRRPTRASSSTSAPAGPGPSRCRRTFRCWSARRAPKRTSSGSRSRPTVGSPHRATSTSTPRSSFCRTPGPRPAARVPRRSSHWISSRTPRSWPGGPTSASPRCCSGLPDKSDAEVAAYVERLAGKLAALV